MISYMYKAEFEFDQGSGTSEGEVQAESLSVATTMIENYLCERYIINKDDIKSIAINTQNR
ncbi:MAG: hypothetical protein JKY62_16985 [Desulfocapsa sp.]|nr:hypothetical protein [Desulfocapsa sp.]